MAEATPPLLSICIATYNRAGFIAETLDSILPQMTPRVELLVLDGASPDNTPQLMAGYQSRYPLVRYIREAKNSGVDCDYDKAVGHAAGEYCWLMSDDDILRPGAVQRVLAALEGGEDLVIVNTEIWNATFSEKLLDRRLNFGADRRYGAADREKLLVDAANQMGFIGCVVIRRSLWLARERSAYYGSLFVHVGVIFQLPPIAAALVMDEPCIAIRNGNALWAARTFEVWAIKWPELIWSFPGLSDAARRAVCEREQWRKFKFVFFHRAMGSYSLTEYRKFLASRAHGAARLKAWIAAAFPGRLANLIVVLYYFLFKRAAHLPLFDVLCSRFATPASRFIARLLGVQASVQK